MPLVRISLRAGKSARYRKDVGDIVYRTMVDTIGVPPGDNFQIITEHDEAGLIYDPDYLGIHRSDGVIFIQISLLEGRSVELKKAFYKALAERLHERLGVRLEDVFIGLLETRKEDWSFGNGIAQYVP